ncbi:calcium-binding protein [uncultured Phenylobacterium sp.]|uniref:calcium-binding protein n=1 Tax=uncultured Phenylobacterium sp. TaxID=349273 RepID=UPI0025D77AC4|nr:calcium-binding protein [uncultured Phenylobacterium sp.]
MSKISYNPGSSTVTFNDVAALTIGATTIVTSNATTLALQTTVSGLINGTLDVVFGGNFTLLGGFPTGGEFTSLRVDLNSQTLISITDFVLPYGQGAPDFSDLSVFLGGADELTGSALNDVVSGFAGADTANGGAGIDIMNGNQGNDTISGGDGIDVVRGGKDNDSVSGGAGDDFVSGDRGSDTLSGGTGADLFHTFAGAGLDRVTDFSRAEGDRVLVLGNQYTVSQSGADVLIDLGSGDQMVLVGVQQSSLTDGWIISI